MTHTPKNHGSFIALITIAFSMLLCVAVSRKAQDLNPTIEVQEYSWQEVANEPTMLVSVIPETTKKVETTKAQPKVETTKKVEKKNIGEGVQYTQSELDFMAAAICQECGGESRYIKVRVANVMVNRVLSKNFPNSIEGVLTQKRQYDLYSGRNFPKWATKENIAECYEVAEAVLSGEERPFPENVVFQAAFTQGDGIQEHCHSVLGGGGYYFCYIAE